MPETRVVSTTYDRNGNVIEQVTRVVSDAELAVEALEQEVKQDNDQALRAYQSWGSLTVAQKDRALKMLLGDFISRNRKNYIS